MKNLEVLKYARDMIAEMAEHVEEELLQFSPQDCLDQLDIQIEQGEKLKAVADQAGASSDASAAIAAKVKAAGPTPQVVVEEVVG